MGSESDEKKGVLDRSPLRDNAPRIRTSEALSRKYEQIFDALERDAIMPKVAEQMGQQLKGLERQTQMEMRYIALLMKYGRKAPVPRNPIARSLLGLPEKPSPNDAEQIRKITGTD